MELVILCNETLQRKNRGSLHTLDCFTLNYYALVVSHCSVSTRTQTASIWSLNYLSPVLAGCRNRKWSVANLRRLVANLRHLKALHPAFGLVGFYRCTWSMSVNFRKRAHRFIIINIIKRVDSLMRSKEISNHRSPLTGSGWYGRESGKERKAEGGYVRGLCVRDEAACAVCFFIILRAFGPTFILSVCLREIIKSVKSV